MDQPRIKKTNQSKSPQAPLKGPTAQEVLSTTLEQMGAWVKLQRPDRSRYTVADLLSVVLYMAKERTTIEEAASSLQGAPHPNTVRGALTDLEVERLTVKPFSSSLRVWVARVTQMPYMASPLLQVEFLPCYTGSWELFQP